MTDNDLTFLKYNRRTTTTKKQTFSYTQYLVSNKFTEKKNTTTLATDILKNYFIIEEISQILWYIMTERYL